MNIFNAVRGLAGKGAGSMFTAALGRTAAGQQNLGRLIGFGGKGLRGISKMSNVGLSAMGGGLAGGVYGAFSDDTSVLGGIAMGAGLGAGGYGAVKAGIKGYGRYSMARQAGFGAGQSLGAATFLAGQDAARFIGNTYSRAMNPIRGLSGGVSGFKNGFRRGFAG